jgi:hypothetical protein
MRQRQVQPLSQDLVRDELREVTFEGGVVFARRADEKAIPWVFAVRDGKIEPVVQIRGIEAE